MPPWQIQAARLAFKYSAAMTHRFVFASEEGLVEEELFICVFPSLMSFFCLSGQYSNHSLPECGNKYAVARYVFHDFACHWLDNHQTFGMSSNGQSCFDEGQ